MNSIANAPYTGFEQGPELLLTPSWQILRQQILHLAQFGGGVQVICGPEGAGKSTFLAFLQKAADAEGFYSWQVPAHCDNAALFRYMLQALGLRPGQQAGAGELIYSLRNYAQSLERSKQRLIFAFDDAHHLGNPELAALISVLQGSSESGFGLHFILLAEPGLAERIDELHLVDVSVQDVQLPSFSPAELNTVFSNTFLAPGEPLTLHGEALERVWVQSEGLPGRALEMARALKTRPPEEEEKPFKMAGLPVWHIGALGLLGVVLLWALVFRDSGETPQEGTTITATSENLNRIMENQRRTVPIEIVENPRPDRAAVANPAARTLEPDAPGENELRQPPGVRESTDVAARPPEVDPAGASTVSRSGVTEAETDGAAPDTTAMVQSDSAETVAPDLEATLAERLDASEDAAASRGAADAPTAEPAEETSAAETGTAQAPGSDVTAPTPPSTSAELQDFVDVGERALLALVPTGYVLQLMATTTEDSLREYIARQPNRRNLLVHRADRNGKRMYLLVEGFYADKDAAQSAIHNLPPEQQAGKPWPKKVSAIHEEIRQVRRN